MPMLRVRTTWSGLPGSPFLSTAYFDGAADATDAQASVDHLQACWTAQASGINATLQWSVSGSVDVIDPVTGELTGNIGVTTRTGTPSGAGDWLPNGVGGVLKLQTGTFLAGRRIGGKWFIPAPLEGENTLGSPVSAYVTRLLTAAGNLLSAPNPPTLSVWSRKNGVLAHVTSFQVLSQWGMVRSRRT